VGRWLNDLIQWISFPGQAFFRGRHV